METMNQNILILIKQQNERLDSFQNQVVSNTQAITSLNIQTETLDAKVTAALHMCEYFMITNSKDVEQRKCIYDYMKHMKHSTNNNPFMPNKEHRQPLNYIQTTPPQSNQLQNNQSSNQYQNLNINNAY